MIFLRLCNFLIILVMINSFATKGFAGERIIVDFAADFSGTTVDSLFVSNEWGGILRIDTVGTVYSPIIDTTISSSIVNGGLSANSYIQTSADNSFWVAWMSWEDMHIGSNADIGEADAIYINNYVLDGLDSDIQSNIGLIAKDDDGRTDSPPTSFSMVADDDGNYVAYWGSWVGGYVKHASSKHRNHLAKWPTSFEIDTVGVVSRGGEPTFDLMVGSDLADTSLIQTVVAHVLQENSNSIGIRVEIPEGDTLFGPDTVLTINSKPPRSPIVKVAQNGTILLAWQEGDLVGGPFYGEIYLSAYTDSLTPIAGMQKILVTTNTLGRGRTFSHLIMKTFDVVAVDDDLFTITYGDGSTVFARTINTANQTLGAVQTITPGCNSCFYPTLTMSPDSSRLAISYFGNYKKTAADTAAQISLFQMTGSPRIMDLASQTDFDLSTRQINYSHNYGKRVHYYGNVNAGVDNLGNILSTYNYEDQSWVTAWSNVDFYHDTANYRSGDLVIPAGFLAEPYDPTKDSIEWASSFIGIDTNISVDYRFSSDGIFSDDSVLLNAAQEFPVGTKTNGNHYQYHVQMRSSDHDRVSPRIDSMVLKWNVRPRDILIDSIRIGMKPFAVFNPDSLYRVINRLDTVRIKIRGFDYDNPEELNLTHSEDAKLIGNFPINQSVGLLPAGWFRHEIVYTPLDTIADSFNIILNWSDSLGWASKKDSVHLQYYNIAPEDSVFVTYPKGGSQGDSISQVDPMGFYRIQMGDSVLIRIVALDSNDTHVKIEVKDSDSLILFRDTLNVVDSVEVKIPHDPIDTLPMVELGPKEIDLTIDTVYVISRDGNVETRTQIILVPNHTPWIDSIKNVAYMDSPSNYKDTLIYQNLDIYSDRGLTVIPFVPNKIVAFDRDPDEINFDSSYVEWYLLEVDSTGACCLSWPEPISRGDTLILGTEALYGDTLEVIMGADKLQVVGRDNLTDWYQRHHRLRMVTYDVTGAFREDTVALKYPRLDTTNFKLALDSLVNAFDMVLGSQTEMKSINSVLTSTGTAPLVISSVYTLQDQSTWLSYKLNWKDTTGTLLSVYVESKTDSSRFKPAVAITLNQFQDLTMQFSVDVSQLVGDSILVDTIYLQTNDFFNPLLKIPIRLVYNDYPKVKVYYEPTHEEDTLYTRDSLIQSIPLNGRLIFAFTEPVMESNIHHHIKIFSVFDNLSRGLSEDSLVNFVSELGNRVSRIDSKYSKHFKRIYSTLANGSKSIQYIDTLVFTPNYMTVSDSFKVRPPPESFMIGDRIHVWISNEIRDSTGNQLDLSWAAPPPSDLLKDSLISTSIDVSTFQVKQDDLFPQPGGSLAPDAPIRIPFDSRLVEYNVFNSDSIFSLDFNRMGSGNRTVRLTSKRSQWDVVQLKSIQLENNDSTIVVYPKRNFYSNDSIRIQVFSNLSDWKGRTLDGDFDSTYNYLFWCYDTPNRTLNSLCTQGLGLDTVDQFDWKIAISDEGFYSFPNPYRHYRSDHRKNGGIVFKNLHKIKGLKIGEPLHVRVFTLNGELIHSSKRLKKSVVFEDGKLSSPEYIWNARNNHGKLVATGLYLFAIESDNKVVQKGKVAVIR